MADNNDLPLSSNSDGSDIFMGTSLEELQDFLAPEEEEQQSDDSIAVNEDGSSIFMDADTSTSESKSEVLKILYFLWMMRSTLMY